MKKRYFVVPAALALLLALCTGGSELPEGFDKNKVLLKSKQFIKRLNARDYQGCFGSFNEMMKGSFSLEKMESTMNPIFDVLGDFVRVKGVSLTSKHALGTDYAVCTVKCIYENGPANFTLSLDPDLRIGGLYIK